MQANTEHQHRSAALACAAFQRAWSPRKLPALPVDTREVHALRGDILFHKGDTATGFHLIVYGQVKLAFTSAQGGEKVVDILGQGQSFGEAVMFMDKPYMVYAQALSDSLLLHISKKP